MANYKEIEVVGTEYQHHSRFCIENPVAGVPTCMFVEETVIDLEGLEVEVKPAGSLCFPYNANDTFIVYNSSTGEPYASTTLNTLVDAGQIRFKMSFLKEVILSLYKAKAEERDGA